MRFCLDRVVSQAYTCTTMSDSVDQKLTMILSKVTGLESSVSGLESDLASLTRHVVRIDERLTDVEQHTALIPGMVETLSNLGFDVDNHERRIQRLERKTI
jgi:hypothetical protein